ncbi:hypothetical protein [Shinella zoogloeoides]|uniref:hypothetical protein n=1 Tax=Shinella zoogloeoides TaxID=352475 RepID=UPI00273E1DA2|nr:hypothetical protein [Shinella zoogloeoides]WLR92192.1 hypothetical protein Q9316_17250 [Shinella zoogloeoides]
MTVELCQLTLVGPKGEWVYVNPAFVVSVRQRDNFTEILTHHSVVGKTLKVQEPADLVLRKLSGKSSLTIAS